MNKPQPKCRSARKEDLAQIVDVHIAAFPGFFLTTLGSAFLRTMYLAFLSNREGIFVVHEANGRIDGFAVGLLKSAGKDRRMAIAYMPRFVLVLIPAVLRQPGKVLKRIFAQFFSIGEEPEIPESAAVLRSIAVLSDKRGQGAAGQLLMTFEKNASLKGAGSIALTTDEKDNARAINFYGKYGYTVQQRFVQHGAREMLLLLKNI